MPEVCEVMIHDDVRTLTAARILELCGRLPSVVVGSPPCQDASLANHRGRGVDGDRTGLFFEAIRLVDEIRPAWCCFENVLGLRTRGADRVLGEMEALGYTCWPLVVGAVHAGAPHRRQRVWIIAADAERVGLWEQSGWSGGTRGIGETVTPVDDPRSDADGCRQPGEPERNGRPPAGIDSAPGDDAFGSALCADTARRRRGSSAGSDTALAELTCTDCHTYSARLEVGEDERSDILEKFPPALRAIAARSPWNGGPGGLARRHRVADGISDWLAQRGIPFLRRTISGIQKAQIAAYGDAVLPQITCAIGRTMQRHVPTDRTVLDLFAGAAGGWSLGLHWAGYRTIAACEIDPWRRFVLMSRWNRNE